MGWVPPGCRLGVLVMLVECCDSVDGVGPAVVAGSGGQVPGWWPGGGRLSAAGVPGGVLGGGLGAVAFPTHGLDVGRCVFPSVGEW